MRWRSERSAELVVATLEACRRDGRSFLARRSAELVWFRAISRLPRRKCENSFRLPCAVWPPPRPFLVRSFWFFFGNVLSFSSPTTSGRSFLEQGSEESVFFPTQFLFFRDATTLVSEHSLCLFPWRFWFLSLFFISCISVSTKRTKHKPNLLFVSNNNLWPQFPGARSGGVFFRRDFSSSTRHKKLG
jgi:hypothetical protein